MKRPDGMKLVNIADYDKRRPLHLASEEGHLEGSCAVGGAWLSSLTAYGRSCEAAGREWRRRQLH